MTETRSTCTREIFGNLHSSATRNIIAQVTGINSNSSQHCSMSLRNGSKHMNNQQSVFYRSQKTGRFNPASFIFVVCLTEMYQSDVQETTTSFKTLCVCVRVCVLYLLQDGSVHIREGNWVIITLIIHSQVCQKHQQYQSPCIYWNKTQHQRALSSQKGRKSLVIDFQVLPSNMVLMVTDCLAISTSTSKISPSELCSFIVGIICRVDVKYVLE